MRSHELNETHPRKTARRVGRGISAGQGKTAGRGTKGQKSRTGFNIPRTFDGGAANFIQRLPKLKGFKSHREKPAAVTVATLQRHFDSGTVLTLESLVEKGIISASEALRGVKIIGSVEGYEFSLSEGQNLTATRSRK